MPYADESNAGRPPSGAAENQIILEERLDPNYEPTAEEVREYAEWLGMELPEDSSLLWIAREGLKEPLPPEWKPCKTLDTGNIYFFNFATGQSSWEHPCDGKFIDLFQKEKQAKPVKPATPSKSAAHAKRTLDRQGSSNLSAGGVYSEDEDEPRGGDSKHSGEIRKIKAQIAQLREDISESRREAEAANARAAISEVARKDAEARAQVAEEEAQSVRQILEKLTESSNRRRELLKEELDQVIAQLLKAEDERDAAEKLARTIRQDESRKLRQMEREVEQLRARLMNLPRPTPSSAGTSPSLAAQTSLASPTTPLPVPPLADLQAGAGKRGVSPRDVKGLNRAAAGLPNPDLNVDGR
jgi:hypothetical protein